ncbi:MAG: hypothetical protein RLZZ292_1947 [Bacteroidota bacterium]|jgi:endonuclease YncB( thermonuclease family)
MRIKLTHILLLLTFTSSCVKVAHAGELRGAAYAIDGDTLNFYDWNIRVRLWGIDAPEKNQICFDAQAQSYPCGVISKNALAAIVEGVEVICHDKTQVDRYNRRVMICEAGGYDIGATIVRYGYALDMPKYSHGFYSMQQEQAKSEKIGVHGGIFQDPADFRRKLRGN